MKKYKVVVYTTVPVKTDKSLKTPSHQAMEYRTISSGLSWKEAKELRAINTAYMIVPDKETLAEPVEETENVL
jgi:hypothetical protein